MQDAAKKALQDALKGSFRGKDILADLDPKTEKGGPNGGGKGGGRFGGGGSGGGFGGFNFNEFGDNAKKGLSGFMRVRI